MPLDRLDADARHALIDAKVANERKNMGVAYVLWAVFGGLGVHNFYLGSIKSALFQLLALPVIIVALIAFDGPDSETSVGEAAALALLGAWAVSVLLDLALIPWRINAHAERRRQQYLSGERSLH